MKKIPVYKCTNMGNRDLVYCILSSSFNGANRLTVFAWENSDVEKLECQTVGLNQYYNDSFLALDDVIDRVDNGTMHKRAIALALELLL